MGAGISSPISSPFDVFAGWKKDRVEQVIDEYKQKDYDFGIDAATTSMLLGVDLQVSKDVISKMSRSGTGIINALSLISGIVIMSSELKNHDRFRLVFDVFDFDSSGSISMDEMTILLLSASKAIHVMTNSRLTEPSDPGMEKVTINAFKTLELEMGGFINKDAFVNWGTDFVKAKSDEFDAAAVLILLSDSLANSEEASISIEESVPPPLEQEEEAPELDTQSESKAGEGPASPVGKMAAEVPDAEEVPADDEESGGGDEPPVSDGAAAEVASEEPTPATTDEAAAEESPPADDAAAKAPSEGSGGGDEPPSSVGAAAKVGAEEPTPATTDEAAAEESPPADDAAAEAPSEGSGGGDEPPASGGAAVKVGAEEPTPATKDEAAAGDVNKEDAAEG